MSILSITENDIEDRINSLFEEASAVKTEVNIVTYDEDNNKLHSENSEYTLRFKRDDIADDKEMKKFIRKCETMIRTCPEYSDWVDYIRNVMEMTECQLSGELHSQAKSDIHHHPICLYTMVKAVIMKHIVSAKEFSSIDVIDEVMDMHYKMRVPFIVLLKSIHDKYHGGFMELPIELCHGDLSYFIQTYGHYMEADDLDPILEKLKINWSNCGYSPKKYSWKEDD